MIADDGNGQETRTAGLAKVKQLEAEEAKHNSQLEALRQNDPAVLAELGMLDEPAALLYVTRWLTLFPFVENKVKVAKTAADRWTGKQTSL